MEEKEILDTSVAIERKEGTITIFTAIEYPSSLKKSFEFVFPEIPDYLKSVEIAGKLQEKGMPVGAVDVLIAAMCINRSAMLLTKDNDFQIIKDNFPDLIFRKL
ncbi:hypothetical protein HYU10_01005 [Candidatus Woesearchaeota archaeon]|nr:hypothetical protein [Candidatus Woesearchaeota archaeon]MBI2660817.1 hypothetical protein [Candidatus Woesearchaeota archaeon]